MNEKILDIIVDVCEEDGIREDLDVNLFETALMDSLGFLQMLVYFENEFNIEIQPTEIAREDMDTPNKIIALVKVKARIS